MLMVSGVGPEATLKRLWTRVIAIREGVGQKMGDQCSVAIIQQVNVETQAQLFNPATAAAATAEYIANPTGLLTSGGADQIGKT